MTPEHQRCCRSVLWPRQEDEARLKPGTIKRCALEVLKPAGAAGLPIGTIVEGIQAQNLRQWDPNSKRVIQFVRRQPCAHVMSC